MTINSTQISREYITNKIKSFYESNYASRDIGIIKTVLDNVIDLFNGKKEGFQRCDAQYHNLTHTLQTIPPFVDIIDGWNKSSNTPKVSEEFFGMGIIAVLLHDTGYIKKEGDTLGTGAKYTFEHIQRSIDFASRYLAEIGFDKQKITQIKNVIGCTGVSINLERFSFASEEERITGYALGTADLLGQMAADDYPEKLPVLFKEYDESYNYIGIEEMREQGIKKFENADELLASTKDFYEATVMERFKKMGSIYKYVESHHPGMKNLYIEAIEENIRRIESSPAKKVV